jgi:ABC-type Fe3+ transport system permease subunit
MVDQDSVPHRPDGSEPDRSNPYRAPHASDERVSAVPAPGRRFRFRVIPATLLWAVSALVLIWCSFMLGALAYFFVLQYWAASDPEELRFMLEELTKPPVIACFLSALSAGVCGMFGAAAWVRGRWQRAAVLSAAFILLLAFAGYVTGELS